MDNDNGYEKLWIIMDKYGLKLLWIIMDKYRSQKFTEEQQKCPNT